MPRTAAGTFALLGLLLAAGGAAPAPLPPPLAIPEDWTLAWQAPTVPALIDKARPVLTFPSPRDDAPMFLWTGTGKTGVRWFRVATARRVQEKSGKPQWAIARMQNGVFIEDGKGWLPVQESAVRKTVPVHTDMGAPPWAHVVATDPRHGTLFEIEVYFQSMGEAAQGWRLLVLQDAAGGWRYVGSTLGDYWDETGWIDHTRLSARWTDQPEQPLEVFVQWRGWQYVNETGQCTGRAGMNLRFAGAFPFDQVHPVARDDYLEVMPGNTYSGLIELLIECRSLTHRDDAPALLSRAVLRLNPGLNPNRLLPGQRLMIPAPLAIKRLVESPPKVPLPT